MKASMKENPMQLASVRIETQRLSLIPIEDVFEADIFREFSPEVTRYMDPKPASCIEETRAFIASSREGLERGDNLQLVILSKPQGEFLGCIGLHEVGSKNPGVGIWVKISAHGQGYGLEAGRSLIEWARSNCEFDHLRYPVDRRNGASRRIAEACGGKVARAFKSTSQAGFELEQVEYWIPKAGELELDALDIGESAELRIQAARILSAAFSWSPLNPWPVMQSALEEVDECLEGESFCVGLRYCGRLAGWAGLRPMYDRTWELHPMAVDPQLQGIGLGRVLLNNLEEEAHKRGIEGILLGTDDEEGRTSLSAVDLNAGNILSELAHIKNLAGHPFEFYRACGYAIVGAVPNANGKRKPDIWMWKGLEP